MTKISQIPAFSEIISSFQELTEVTERYEYLMELGSLVPELDNQQKTPKNQIVGCSSRAWLIKDEKISNSEKLFLKGYSDSLLVRGLILILISATLEIPFEKIKKGNFEILEQLNLPEILSGSRQLGLQALLKRIQLLAVETCA